MEYPIELAITEIVDQRPVVLMQTSTAGYRVQYGEESSWFETLKQALNSYNQCCLHAETAAGFHD